MEHNIFLDEFPTSDKLDRIKDLPPKVLWKQEDTKDSVTIQKKSPNEDYWYVSVKSNNNISYELSSQEGKWQIHNINGTTEKDMSKILEHTYMTATCGEGISSDRFHPSYEKSSLKVAKDKYEEKEKKERKRYNP